MMRSLIIIACACVTICAMPGCTIQPPLKLADSVGFDFAMPEVVTELNVIWDTDDSWRSQWWYGWDEEDIRRYGELNYPTPSDFEARIYFLGSSPTNRFSNVDYYHFKGNRFARVYPFGWHDMLIWSNIDSPDGTQVLKIDESDPGDIHATTSMTSIGYTRAGVYNNPEIFYAGMPETFYVSDNPLDYDYYDADRKVYVKTLQSFLTPLVYTYLVQVALYNNNSRITGMADHSVVTSLADGVSVHTGHTHSRDIPVSYDMRFKRQLPARDGRMADILGGKLTTFGLCDMEPWSSSRGTNYEGSRADLVNHAVLNFQFSNSSDSVYLFDITPQMQRQAHGGVITIEIDVDTLGIPTPGSHGTSSAFDPVVAPLDSITHEFEI